jgi:hypothetical protein
MGTKIDGLAIEETKSAHIILMGNLLVNGNFETREIGA